MKFVKFILFFILFFPFNTKAQHILSANLILNPGFESFTQCPYGLTQIDLAYPWTCAHQGGSSSDYFNTCTSNPGLISYLTIQQPRTGNGMAGIIVYGLWIGHNYREYISGVMLDSLKKRKLYCSDFYVSFSNLSKGAIENIGMYFSTIPVSYSGNLIPLTYLQPQIVNHKGIIKDTINWVKISGIFVASGGEKYLMLGNFKDNANTNYLEVSYGVVAPYYLFDDVSVCECSFDINLGENTKICEGDNIILTPNLPNATYTWQDSSHIVSYKVKQPGTYWVRAYVAEYDITTTDTITFTAEDETLCNPPLLIPNFITPNGDDNNDFFSIGNSDKYELNLQVFNRWGNLIHQNENYQNDFNCKECADGVFYYLLKSKSKRNGKEKEYKGSMTVFSKQ